MSMMIGVERVVGVASHIMLVFGMAVTFAALVFAIIARLLWEDQPDPFSPGLLLVLYLGVAYVVDPLYIALTHVYGFNDKYAFVLGSGQLPDLTFVVLLGLGAIVTFAIGVRL